MIHYKHLLPLTNTPVPLWSCPLFALHRHLVHHRQQIFKRRIAKIFLSWWSGIRTNKRISNAISEARCKSIEDHLSSTSHRFAAFVWQQCIVGPSYDFNRSIQCWLRRLLLVAYWYLRNTWKYFLAPYSIPAIKLHWRMWSVEHGSEWNVYFAVYAKLLSWTSLWGDELEPGEIDELRESSFETCVKNVLREEAAQKKIVAKQ